MEKKSKPQWLLDVEKDIEEFHQTEIGSLSDKAFRRKENARINGSMQSNEDRSKAGKSNTLENWRKANKAQTKEDKSKGGKIGGPKGGKIGGKIGGAIQGNTMVTCPHCNKEGKLMPMNRWHFDNCIKNPDNKISKHSIGSIVTCPHCNKEGAKQSMTRWHFDNCKHKHA
jgi:hypothetical protein